MNHPKFKYQPSIKIERLAGESAKELVERVLRDPRLLPDQRASLEQDRPGPFDDLMQGIWLERPPIEVPG